VLWGLSSFYVARADVQAACEIGEQLLSLAGRMQDTGLLIEAYMRFGLPLYLRESSCGLWGTWSKVSNFMMSDSIVPWHFAMDRTLESWGSVMPP
ncbi:MAG TPA: hypothetical protein VGX03_01765, partial [Candidatus Binatia bacterium]|nr:hypothetical protein [Candidatus Binatia bacterium]